MEKSISEINSWSDNYLKQQNARLEKYNPSTRLRIKQVYATRFQEGKTFAKVRETTAFKDTLEQQQDTNKKIDAIIKSASPTKRRAGQSQILERNNLIRSINQESAKYSIFRKNGQTGGANAKRTLANIQSLQIALANLLTRYQF